MLEFLCPNGHHIRCPVDQAGRAGQCPKCGVRFRVPSLDETTRAAENHQSAVETREPQIEFLCPNGHRLHGPQRLQGRPGQCPDCGARFRIPAYDEAPDDAPASGIHSGRIDGGASGILLDRRRENHAAGESRLMAMRALAIHPLAHLIERLWREQTGDTPLELVLASGETLRPRQFLKKHSQSTHGVFVVPQAEGSLAVHAIRWESIEQVRIRGLSEIPRDLAE